MIQNFVVLNNRLKTGSDHGTGTEWDCAFSSPEGVRQVVAREFRRRYQLVQSTRTFSYSPKNVAYRLAITAPY